MSADTKKTGKFKPEYIIYGIVITVLIVLLVIAAVRKKRNSFECETHDLLGIEKIKKIDPELIICELAYTFDPSVENAAAVACDFEGNFYVAGSREIVVFNASGEEKLRIPVRTPATCLAVSEDQNLFLGTKRSVEIYSASGWYINSMPALDPDAYITSIAVSLKHVFVADAGHRLVYKTTRPGELLAQFGKTKSETKGDLLEFIVPSPHFDIALFDENSLWVINPGRHKFLNLDEKGNIRTSWGEFGSGIAEFCGCCNPTDFAIAPDGSFVTSEKGLIRVKLYGPDGTFKGVVAGPDEFTAGAAGLDLAVDPENRIFVLDPDAGIVKVFTLK